MPKISELPSTSSPATTAVVPVVDGGVTKKVTIADLVTASGGGGGGGSANYPIDLTDGAEVDVPATGIVKSNGTALSSFAPGTGIETFLTTPSGANLASALTTSLPNTKGGTGQDSSAWTGLAQLTAGVWSALTIAAGVATFLGTPSSANLRSLVTDETGTGSLVFGTSPTLTTPNIGAATGTSLDVSSFVEAEYLRFATTDPRAAAGLIRLDPYTNDLIAIREHDDAVDRVALSQWHVGSNVHELWLGAGQDALTPFDRVVINGATSVRALVGGSYTAWSASVNGVQFGSNSVDLGGGTGVLGLDNATVVPTTNPTDGIVLYSEANVLKYRQPAGTIVTLSGGGGSVGGADTQVLFNDGGTESGDSGLTFNKTTDVLSVTGGVSLGGGTVHTAALVAVAYSASTRVLVGVKDSTGNDRVALSQGGGDQITVGNTAQALNVNGAGHVHSSSTGTTYRYLINAVDKFTIATNGVQFHSSSQDFGGGVGVIGIDNAGTNPTTNPTAGGILYSDAGAGKWRGSSGTVTTFGPADLDGFKATTGKGHCPSCGTDFALEWANDKYGGLTVCVHCLATELGDRPWIVRRQKEAA